MARNEGNVNEDLWSPYKELVTVIENYLAREGDAQYGVQVFESVLRRHKQTFLSLMKNPTKNVTNREEIKRGISDGVILPSTGKTLLPKAIVDEAIIIADMWDVNEYLALELLHTAQRQASRYPGTPRGLVAVLLYYDGRKAIATALKELVMARDGVSWCISARTELINYVSRYVDSLIADGLLERVLDTLKSLNMTNELELLHNNGALGTPKYNRQIMDTFESIRKQLAGVLFAASAQKGLPADTLMRLYKHLCQTPLSTGSTGEIDDVTLGLHMALLYAIDLSVLHRREDGEELVKKLPLMTDQDLLSALATELTPQPQSGQVSDLNQTGITSLCQLALGLALATLKRAPQSVLRRNSNSIRPELLDQDDALVDAAIEGKVFDYIYSVLLSNANSAKEEFYARRLHSLITDFIVLMHSKLMEIRMKSDEAARALEMYAAEGLNPPALENRRSQYEALLRCMERLYSLESLSLKEEFWIAAEQQHSVSYRYSSRSATLYKMVRVSGSVSGNRVVASYVRFLSAVTVKTHTFALLARTEPGLQPTLPLSWDHIFSALYNYLCNLRVDPLPLPEQHHITSMGATAVVSTTNRNKLLVRDEEVEALIATLKLIQAVAKVDSEASVAFCENLRWDAINCLFGLLSCHISLSIKGELILALAALGSGSCAARIWAGLEASKLVPSAESMAHGLHTDLAEVESRQEEYPLTRGFLELMLSISKVASLPLALGAGNRAAGLDPYLFHIIRRILLPAATRPYARPAERWQVYSMSLQVISLWLKMYEPRPSDFALANKTSEINPPPGLHIMLQLHSRSELLRLLIQLLGQIVDALEEYRLIPSKEHMESTLVCCLDILETALANEKAFTHEAAIASCTIPIAGLSKLLLDKSVGGGVEALLACCRLVGASDCASGAPKAALKLLHTALQHPNAHHHLFALVHDTHKTKMDIRHGFVECLDLEDWNGSTNIRTTKESILAVLQHCLISRNENLTHFFCGITGEANIPEPGINGAPRTALHSILAILEAHRPEHDASSVTEACYCLIYWLCARPYSSRATLRLLSSRDNFLLRHVQTIQPLEKASTRWLSAKSWCIRALACELASTAPTPTTTVQILANTQDYDCCLIRKLINGLPLEVEQVAEPMWECFHAPQLRKAILLCDMPTGTGKRISFIKLHQTLLQELATLNPTAPQRNMLNAEIQKVLDYCTAINSQRNLASTLTHYYDSWRQLCEVLFCVYPTDDSNIDSRRILLLSILQDLVEKIFPEKVVPLLGVLASGTILLLLVNMRHCYMLKVRDDSTKKSESDLSLMNSSKRSVRSSSLGLKYILEKIISWLLIPGGTTQKMRINLYGALLNILNLANEKSVNNFEKNYSYVSRLDSSVARFSQVESSLLEVISNVSNELCNTVCADCIEGGHPLCKMIALCCMDRIVDLHPSGRWPSALADRGYLDNLLTSLLRDDEELREVLEPSPKSMKSLFIYESKMTLLMKVASTRTGAQVVLEQNALSCLANLKVLSSRPDCSTQRFGANVGKDFIPSPSERFRQLLLPAFSFCDALLSTLGTGNHTLLMQINNFLFSHMETVDMILRTAHPSSPYGTLQEVEGITSLISRTDDRDFASEREHNSANYHRIETLMLSLLPRFVHYSKPLDYDERSSDVYYKIVSNMMLYTRRMCSSTHARVLLKPTLATQNGPTLGCLIQLLQTLVYRCEERAKALNAVQSKLKSMPTLPFQEIRSVISMDCSNAEARLLGLENLSRLLSVRKDDLVKAAHACEATAHALWMHLRFYISTQQYENKQRLLPIEAAVKSCASDLAELKKGLLSVFNDKFAGELLEVSKHLAPSQRGLLEVLLRDIKSLIQFAPI